MRFPLFVELEEKSILAVGAGKVALRRVSVLESFGANITVVAKDVPKEREMELKELVKRGNVRLVKRAFSPEDIKEEYFFVLAATDDEAVNETVCRMCREKGVPVNDASGQNRCDFYFPAVARKAEQVIGIAGDGRDHGKVTRLAGKIRKWLAEQDE